MALAFADGGIAVRAVISHSGRDAITLAKYVKAPVASTTPLDLPREIDTILIAVPDGAIAEVARELASTRKLEFRNLFAFHTSGVLSSMALDPLKKKGSMVGAIHPIQSFPEGQSVSHLRSKLHGISYGIDGPSEAMAKARELIGKIGGRVVQVPPELKPLYHAACVFSSSYLLVMLNAIAELNALMGIQTPWTEIYGPLLTTAMENAVKQSPGQALTGPILRNDLGTIDMHLQALRDHAPQLLPIYMTAALEVARIAQDGGRIDRHEYELLRKHFQESLKKLIQKKSRKAKR